mmetsp:Transcript_73083/g.171402  ORF Transcript_73083/g.171402 Transcript_73083/m.171402 type:complete len:266 (-) Transcript_73083:51-848(-)
MRGAWWQLALGAGSALALCGRLSGGATTSAADRMASQTCLKDSVSSPRTRTTSLSSCSWKPAWSMRARASLCFPTSARKRGLCLRKRRNFNSSGCSAIREKMDLSVETHVFSSSSGRPRSSASKLSRSSSWTGAAPVGESPSSSCSCWGSSGWLSVHTGSKLVTACGPPVLLDISRRAARDASASCCRVQLGFVRKSCDTAPCTVSSGIVGNISASRSAMLVTPPVVLVWPITARSCTGFRRSAVARSSSRTSKFLCDMTRAHIS